MVDNCCQAFSPDSFVLLNLQKLAVASVNLVISKGQNKGQKFGFTYFIYILTFIFITDI